MSRPSRIDEVKLKHAWWLLKSFKAIMLFGTMYYNCDESKITSIDKNHERIHVRQAESTSDCWILYYLKYIWLWLCNILLVFVNIYAPYKFNEFELEAYEYEDDMTYVPNGPAEHWKELRDKLTYSEKKELAKIWYGRTSESYMIKAKGFTWFIKNYVDV